MGGCDFRPPSIRLRHSNYDIYGEAATLVDAVQTLPWM